MKEIMAIIRQNKINATKTALIENGFPSFTATKVMGRGKKSLDKALLEAMEKSQVDAPEMLPLIAKGPTLMPKRMISLVVPDDVVPNVVKIIIESNKTGNPGDGKIFVMPVSDVVRVRTGETGENAVDEMKGN